MFILAGCAAAALVVAVLLGQWQLVVFAAPMLGVLATARHAQGSVAIGVAAAVVGFAVGSLTLLVLLDRFGSRALLIWGLALMTVGQLGFAFA